MYSSIPLPQEKEIRAFFAMDKSLGRFVRFLKQHLLHVRVTLPACAAIVTAAYNMDTSTLPSPASDFFASEDVESSQDDPVRTGHPDADIVYNYQSGLPAGATVTFGWLLTRQNPGLTTYETVQSSDIDFKALTAVLATASRTSYPPSDGAVCDYCLQSSARLMEECRNVGAENLLKDVGLGAPTCTNCFAAGMACEWQEADREAALL